MLLVYIRRKRFSDEILNGIYLEFKKLILKLFIYRLNKMGESILFCIKLRLLLKNIFNVIFGSFRDDSYFFGYLRGVFFKFFRY